MKAEDALYMIDMHKEISQKQLNEIWEQYKVDIINDEDVLINIEGRYFILCVCSMETSLAYILPPREVTKCSDGSYKPVDNNITILQNEMTTGQFAKWMMRHGSDFGNTEYCDLWCEDKNCYECAQNWLESSCKLSINNFIANIARYYKEMKWRK